MNEPPDVRGGATSPSPRIIIADDHEWIRRVLTDVTRETLPQADVVVTEDGLQALDAYHQKRADFLVTNHAMPNIDGVTLIHLMRREDPELPILMVSVHPEARVDAMEAGANWFLSKNQIMEEMPPILRRHARRAEG